jgi:hypothetical protein
VLHCHFENIFVVLCVLSAFGEKNSSITWHSTTTLTTQGLIKKRFLLSGVGLDEIEPQRRKGREVNAKYLCDFLACLAPLQ